MIVKRITLLFAVILCSISCGHKKNIPEGLTEVKSVVAHLDSSITAMYGWEPRDSTYNHSLDTLVEGMMDEYRSNNPEYERHQNGDIPAIQQQAYDEARDTWATFKQLIDNDKYEEALGYYLGEGYDYVKKNSGDFLVYLKHSTWRYIFYSDVLRPLMEEFKGDDYALDQYVSNLQLEKAMEDMTIDMQTEDYGYIPEVYPYVVRDLGVGLATIGKIDEAKNLFPDMLNGVYGLTGDALFANFSATQFAAQVYIVDDDIDMAIGVWKSFKDYLEENKSDYDAEEIANCMKAIDVAIQDLLGE